MLCHKTPDAVSDQCGDPGDEMMKYLYSCPPLRYINHYKSAIHSIHEVKMQQTYIYEITFQVNLTVYSLFAGAG